MDVTVSLKSQVQKVKLDLIDIAWSQWSIHGNLKLYNVHQHIKGGSARLLNNLFISTKNAKLF